jgi:hypothetical protein
VLIVGAGLYSSLSNDFYSGVRNLPQKIAWEANKDRADTWFNTDWFVRTDLCSGILPFDDKSIDIIMAIDFIEHLSKTDGVTFLNEVDRVCKKVSVIFTPCGFLDTVKYQGEHVHSSLDVHLSGWEPYEFVLSGYCVDIIESLHNFEDVHFDAVLAWKEFK